MLSFTSSLSADNDAFAIFVNDKFHFKDIKNLLSKEGSKKINSYLGTLKDKKSEDEISSLDISVKQKCFIIKVKKKYENGNKITIMKLFLSTKTYRAINFVAAQNFIFAKL